MMHYPEAHWKSPETSFWRVSGFFINKKIDKKININKKIRKPAENLLKIVTAGFQRFPDNPSLTNHTTKTLEFQAEHSKFDHF